MAKTETLLDTGPLVAFFDRRDEHHRWARREMATLPRPFYSCEAVLSEAFHLLEDVPQGTRRLITLLEADRIDLSFSYTRHAERLHELMRTYADQPMSLADACLVRLFETRAAARVFTTDADFRVYRTVGGHALDVLAPA